MLGCYVGAPASVSADY